MEVWGGKRAEETLTVSQRIYTQRSSSSRRVPNFILLTDLYTIHKFICDSYKTVWLEIQTTDHPTDTHREWRTDLTLDIRTGGAYELINWFFVFKALEKENTQNDTSSFKKNSVDQHSLFSEFGRKKKEFRSIIKGRRLIIRGLYLFKTTTDKWNFWFFKFRLKHEIPIRTTRTFQLQLFTRQSIDIAMQRN